MDQNMALLEQGRTNEMNPKVVELLSKYDELTAGGAPKPEAGGGYFPSQQPPPDNKPPSRFEELGRKAAREEIVNGIRAEVETEVITELWAEDVRDLFTTHGQSLVTPEDFAPIDFTDKRRFPNTRTGYLAWKKAASTFIATANQTPEPGDGGDEEVAALAADQRKATSGGQPNPMTAGGAVLNAQRAAKLHKEGKLDNKQFMEVVRREVSSGILTHS